MSATWVAVVVGLGSGLGSGLLVEVWRSGQRWRERRRNKKAAAKTRAARLARMKDDLELSRFSGALRDDWRLTHLQRHVTDLEFQLRDCRSEGAAELLQAMLARARVEFEGRAREIYDREAAQ